MTIADRTATVTARISQDLRAELEALTKATGRTKNDLLEEALRRFVAVERWQLADIEAGLQEADAGDFATAAEMDALRAKYQTPAMSDTLDH